jgi:hypothetical protein
VTVKGGMRVTRVVVGDVAGDASLGLGHGVVGAPVDLLVLDRLPESLD